MVTNRDVYLKVTGFEEEFETIPLLEDYLKALWLIVSQSKEEPLTIEALLRWLEMAFSEEPPPYNPDWEKIEANRYNSQDATIQDWEKTILGQIVDLHQMAEDGSLNNKGRYFGMTAPRGGYWYNFDPLSYLECGISGTMGGYEIDEVIESNQPAEGQPTQPPVFQITVFSWYDFISILECGQYYE